ncbi:AAA family ATPase [Labrenzia sp. CE80]|uniref:AAA family ATPase n=1 Tax=Labrenzia sp. CE80 TaxID=1788986 RepID=UPI00129A41E3|nr:AAA family ATPase [Labrenzia sp. CE80]
MTDTTDLSNFESALDQINIPESGKDVVVVGVCGMAGAGKSTFCEALAEKRPRRVFRFNCDLFSALSLSERTSRIEAARRSGDPVRLLNEEDPLNWYAWDEIHKAIEALRHRREFSFNQAWNRETGQLDARYDLFLPGDGQAIVLCDCIFLLHHPVRTWFDHILLIEASAEIIASRRARRSSDAQVERHAQERQKKFEMPYFKVNREFADAILNEQSA